MQGRQQRQSFVGCLFLQIGEMKMPRGDNPNSRANLIKNSDLTPKERKEKAKKMGIASGKARAKLKSFRELDAETTTPEERLTMLNSLKASALSGDIKALELYLKIIGEYETKVTANVTADVREPLKNLSLDEIKELIEDA